MILGPSFPFQSFQELDNGRNSLAFEPRSSRATLLNDTNLLDNTQHHETPIAFLIKISIRELLDQIKSGNDINATVEHNNTLANVSHIEEGRHRFEKVFTFDSKFSKCLTQLQVRYNNETEPSAIISVKYRECPNRRYFPETISQIAKVSKTGGGHIYVIVKCQLKELDLTQCPDDQEFVIRIPPNSEVSIRNKPGCFFTKQAEEIRPDDIDRMLEVLQERKENPLADTAIVAPSFWSRNLWPLVSAAALGVLLLVAALIRRRQALT